MKLAPIALFTYNHSKQTIEALQKNEYAAASDLIVYSDAPKNENAKKGVENTRLYLNSITGFKSVSVIERENNIGLADNIIDGVTHVVEKFGKIIVMEDDLLTSPFFLKFMNEALNMYEHMEEVVSVHGYVYPVKEKLPDNFFLIHTDSLGWGTWKNAWENFNPDGKEILEQIKQRNLVREFNFNASYNFTKMLKKQIKGKINSWAIRWYGSAFLKRKLSLFPNKSLVFHNGGDNTGTNCVYESWLDVELSEEPIILLQDLPLEENKKARRIYENFFRSIKIPLSIKIKNKLIRLFK